MGSYVTCYVRRSIRFPCSYTNADNPFGDGKLLETFVWNKKLEKEGLHDLDMHEKKKLIFQKQEKNKIELAKVISGGAMFGELKLVKSG